MSNPNIRTDRDPPFGWILLNRPKKLNALTPGMWESIPGILGELEADPEVSVIILRGVGKQAFSVGADIRELQKEFASRSKRSEVPTKNRATELLGALEKCRKPTIAMIHGFCMGGGCAMALSADIRLASSESRFALTPARLGIGYSLRGIQRAVEELGPAGARYLFLTATQIDAPQAKQMGLIQEMHPPSELEAATVALGRKVAGNAPMTLRAIKQSIRHSAESASLHSPQDAESLIQACDASEDFREGVTAFAEKRNPRFRNR